MPSEFNPHADIVSFANMDVRLIEGVGSPRDLTIMDMTVNPHGGAPMHRSLDEAKTFVMTQGRLQFTVGEVTRDVAAGDTVIVAKGDVHGFTNLMETPARMLLVSTPARHDAFFRAMAALPVPHDPNAVREVCETYRQVIVGL
ncbi:cupin [Pandoraea pneumonica]|jgi:quercetin dioxygenase-like cupin family protein|uniref:Cupin n=1 Tax=Pandoraea pneumonica TaxID=2508299 RepID=A0A5E4VP45_9BURK|nr:cupin domain-containing protein [Pandoraea pneumonica]VVE14108.1 cupin [Pandoraea pneumonica]